MAEGAKDTQTDAKPLEKMTAKELREVAKEIPNISGVHGMNKPELVAAIKEARGIVDKKPVRASASVREIKKEIKDFKAKRETALDAKDRKLATRYRRKISRLKKRTRRAA
jgi:hypothetical protein